MGSTTCLAAHKMRYEQFLKISVHTQLLLQADGQIATAKEKRCCKTTKLICCSITFQIVCIPMKSDTDASWLTV